MPLQRFRSVQEMGSAEPAPSDGGHGIAAALALSQLCLGLGGVRLPPGLHRFRSIEAENRQVEAWLQTAARRPRRA